MTSLVTIVLYCILREREKKQNKNSDIKREREREGEGDKNNRDQPFIVRDKAPECIIGTVIN